MNKPLADMSLSELLYEYKFCGFSHSQIDRVRNIYAELERRTVPAPVAVPKPIHDMTFDELWKEHYRLYGEYTLEATHRLDLIINEIKSRRLTGNNA